MKQGIMHCFITVDLGDRTDQFHFTSTDEKSIRNLSCICSEMLDRLGIKHIVNYAYKPMYTKNDTKITLED